MAAVFRVQGLLPTSTLLPLPSHPSTLTQDVQHATQLQHLVLPACAVDGLSARVCYTLRGLPILRRVSLVTQRPEGLPEAMDVARCMLGRADTFDMDLTSCPALTFLPDLHCLCAPL